MIDAEAYKRFFSSFSDFEKKIINNFSKKLSNSQADIYLVMARKAACLIEAFESLGIISLNGIVVSERILDMNEVFLKRFFYNKSVIIIDDTIVSGTTITLTIKKLVSLDVKNIEVSVLTANKKWYTKDLIAAECKKAQENNVNSVVNDVIELIDADSIKFCFDIVKGISVLPNLYDFDFPRFNLGKLKENKIINIFSLSNGWMYYDTSSRMQNDHNIFSYTGIPTKNICKQFDDYLGINLSEVASLKIRFLGKVSDIDNDTCYDNDCDDDDYDSIDDTIGDNNLHYTLYAIPMIVFNFVSKKDVNELYDRICEANNMSKLDIFKTEKSKLRFLQYFFAIKLISLWNNLSGCLDRRKSLVKKRSFMVERMLFTSYGMGKISGLLNSSKRLNFKFRMLNNPSDLAREEIPTYMNSNIENDLILKVKLIEPFLYYYQEKELPCRNAVKQYDYNNYDYEEFRTSLLQKNIDIERLEKGITFNELASRINYTKSTCDYVTFANVFLDKLISRGIAVPVIQEHGDMVFRAYRHGEDAIFGDAENQMVTVALNHICIAANREKLTKIETEKLISLFIKFGIKQKWIDELQDDNQSILNNQIIVSNRHDIFGMRSEIKTQHINDEQNMLDNSFGKHRWFVPYLIKKGYIIQTTGGYKFKGDFTTEIQKGNDAESDLVAFEDTFAEIIKSFDSGKFNADSDEASYFNNTTIEWILTKLASCIYPKDQIDALATEVFIFKQEWEKCIGINFAKFCSGKGNELRDNYNRAIFAINSGQRKYTAYKESEPVEIIEKLSKAFDHRIYIAELQRIIDLRLSDSKLEHTEKLIDDLGEWLISVNYAIRLLNLCAKLKENQSIYNLFVETRLIYNSAYTNILEKLEASRLCECKDIILESINKVKKLAPMKKELDEQIVDLFYYDYRVSNFKRPLNSIAKLLKVKQHLFSNNDLDLNILGNQIIDIINYLVNKSKNILNTAVIELEYYEKPMCKKYYQTAVCIVPSVNAYDLIEKEIAAYIKPIFTNEYADNFPEVHIERNIIIDNSFTIFFENDNKNVVSFLRKIKKVIVNIDKLIVYRNLPGVYSFRMVRKNRDPKFVVHSNSVLGLFNRITSDVQGDSSYIIEVSQSQNYLLDNISLKRKGLDKPILMDDNTKLFCTQFLIPHIEKNKIRVGIITALSEEYEAMERMLLHTREVSITGRGAGHKYLFGYLPTLNGNCPVALCCINGMGNNSAALRAQNMLQDLRNVRYIIMAGIAGAAPNHLDVESHVRLGDVVISDKRGIVQYDLIKKAEKVEWRGQTIASGAVLLDASHALQMALNTTHREEIDNDILAQRPETDVLHDCDGNIVQHPIDDQRINGHPRLFIGGIGSANLLLKDSKYRDKLRDKFKLKAFEMEGSGIADASWTSEAFYTVVRGTCDYCDTFKDNVWHKYAAAVAAAYTKWLIYYLKI